MHLYLKVDKRLHKCYENCIWKIYNNGSFQPEQSTEQAVSSDTRCHAALGVSWEGVQTALDGEAALYQSLVKEIRKRNKDN